MQQGRSSGRCGWPIAFLALRSKIGAMSAVPAPRRPGTVSREARRPRRSRRAAALLALTVLAMTARGAAQEPLLAVWKERKFSFSYNSPTAVYSCRAMAARVANILRAVGARDDIKVRVSGCSNSLPPLGPTVNDRVPGTTEPVADRFHVQGTDRGQVADVYVQLMMPIEVTEEVLAELKRDKSRRELVSRATGNPAAMFNDPVLFTAQRQLVTLSRKTIGIEAEECELLDQVSASVFHQLGVRVVRRDYTCSAGSRIPPQLVVESLLATPLQTGKKDPDPSVPGPSDDGAAEPAADKTAE